jgi:hypothetical protein
MHLDSISKFPEFEKLSLSHQKEIGQFVDQFLPYNDYGFMALYCWDVHNTTLVSNLNDNLIIIINDYNSDDLIMGVMGEVLRKEDVEVLLNYCESLGLKKQLKLIPEHLINEDISQNFQVEEDEGNNDYIYDAESFITYTGRRLRSKKNLFNRFVKNNSNFQVLKIDPFCENALAQCEELLRHCHNKESDFLDEEKKIIKKSLSTKSLDIELVTVFVNDKIAWFCIYEILKQGYLGLHFEKFDTDYEGINAFCKTQIAKIALENNCKYINFEQDLGIEGLRLGKKSFCPVTYLKKYIIKNRI